MAKHFAQNGCDLVISGSSALSCWAARWCWSGRGLR
nr:MULTISPECIES: hypothetical protein [Pseudomonas syringae group]